jgi:hypothetical protein
MRKRRILGAILLSVALLAIVHRYVPFQVDHLILPLVGLGFIVWSVVAKNRGLLIPGCIIAGVGVGNWVQRASHYGVTSTHGQALFLYCVAGGFLLISVLAAAIFRRRELWPIWPAVFIGLTGLIRDGIDLADYVRAVQPYWPFALLAIAIWLLVSRPKGGDKS